ncbi:MAG TPA: hypothetical protein EYP64_01785 [Desulfarculaceae bacterium]|nr:hypothetical protein [Desulfarculaceae bacterium]
MNDLNNFFTNFMNSLNKSFANMQFDWQTIVALIVTVLVLYIAFRIGAIILKIVIGLVFIALVIFAISKLLPYIGF